MTRKVGARLHSLVRKEFRQFFRDPVLLSLVLWLYTIEVVICSVSLTFDLKDEGVAIVDLDRSTASRAVADALDRSPAFAIRARPNDERAALALLDEGEVRLAFVFPWRFGEEWDGKGTATVQLLVDGTNSMVAQTAVGAARRQLVEIRPARDGPGVGGPGPDRGDPGAFLLLSVVFLAIAIATGVLIAALTALFAGAAGLAWRGKA